MHHRALLLIALACLSVAAYAPAPLPRPEKKEAKASLEGTWSVVSQGRAGKETPQRPGSTLKAVITKDRWAFNNNGKPTIEYETVVDDRANPKTVDLKRGGLTPLFRGIYTVDGDTLKLCYYPGGVGGARPKAFDPSDSKQMTMTFKRDKP
jgi:uncharacterized protein (TIGR03067 family)